PAVSIARGPSCSRCSNRVFVGTLAIASSRSAEQPLLDLAQRQLLLLQREHISKKPARQCHRSSSIHPATRHLSRDAHLSALSSRTERILALPFLIAQGGTGSTRLMRRVSTVLSLRSGTF